MFICILVSTQELFDSSCQENKTKTKRPAQVNLTVKASDNEKST